MTTASLESAATSFTKLVTAYRVPWVSCVQQDLLVLASHFLSTTKIEELFKEVKDLKTCLTSIENRTAYECHCHSAPADEEHKYTSRKQDFEKEVQTEC